MKLNPAVSLDAAQVRQRERAAQFIEAMRHDLATLEHFIENADAETLRGNYWCETLQNAELATKRALRAATCEGHARIGRMELVQHGKA